VSELYTSSAEKRGIWVKRHPIMTILAVLLIAAVIYSARWGVITGRGFDKYMAGYRKILIENGGSPFDKDVYSYNIMRPTPFEYVCFLGVSGNGSSDPALLIYIDVRTDEITALCIMFPARTINVNRDMSAVHPDEQAILDENIDEIRKLFSKANHAWGI
jgi:hypothetical protein